MNDCIPIFDEDVRAVLDKYEGKGWRKSNKSARERMEGRMKKALLSLENTVEPKCRYPYFLCSDGICKDCERKGYCP